MLEFMDHVQEAFLDTTGWNRDNFYSALCATSQNILEFHVPTSFELHVSSLGTPNFANSYTLGNVESLEGSLSYIYTNRSLARNVASSGQIDLPTVLSGYRMIKDLETPRDGSALEIWQQGRRIDRPDTLFYGRLYLPHPTLEALYLRQLHTGLQLKVSCVSDSKLPSGGTILAQLQHDCATYSSELLYSTDSALLGLRGLYNFGSESVIPQHVRGSLLREEISSNSPSKLLRETSRPHGRFSAGAEVYYGLLNKSGGLSAGLRFATLPSHLGFPYTMTLTLNPLMGTLSSTYSVLASRKVALSSRFAFNVYSYESELQLGAEIWRFGRRPIIDDLDWARRKIGQPDGRADTKFAMASSGSGASSGCLKARIDSRGNSVLLWEGRIKELLYSCGTTIDLRGGTNMFKGVGLEIFYSA